MFARKMFAEFFLFFLKDCAYRGTVGENHFRVPSSRRTFASVQVIRIAYQSLSLTSITQPDAT